MHARRGFDNTAARPRSLLVEATRRELAEQYLRTSGLSLTQVAYMLGFADQSTFFRACKRWFGMSPGEHRAHVADGA